MINYELLSELAGRYGVATGYTSAGGQYIVTPTSSILYTLTALGVNVSSDPSDEELTRHSSRSTRPVCHGRCPRAW